jgi:hypothetical protein
MISLLLDRTNDVCYNLSTMNENILEVQNARTRLMAKIRDLESNLRREIGYMKQYRNPTYISDVVRRQELLVEGEIQCAKLNEEIRKRREELAPLESQRISLDLLPYAELLKFFDGNNLDTARNALELLAVSQSLGYWMPGASRRVRAGLNYFKISKPRVPRGADRKAALLAAREAFKKAMEPVEALMARWDATRPTPTFTSMGASPTVTATVKSFDAVKVEVCPIKWHQYEYTDSNGKVQYATYGELLWPEGTKHHTSRYTGTGQNRQCEACGHAIKNNFNWVPLILTASDGTPKSLWTGRDCAKTLFGIDMTGDLEIR